MNNLINKITKNKYIIMSLLFAFLIGLPFLWKSINGDDTAFHLINIDLYNNSSLFDKVLSSGNMGFGSGIGIFYPCFPHLVISIICRITNLSALQSLNIFKIIVIILSALSMYFTSKKISNSKLNGMISSMIYVSSSYFYIELFTRDAINEVMLFIFFPLVFLSFYYLFKENNKKRFFIIFSISYICMIYCHLVMSLFFTILLIPFLLLYIKEIFKKDNFIILVAASIFILLFTSTFTVPLIEHMILNKWNLPFKSAWVLPFTFETLNLRLPLLSSIIFIFALPIIVFESILSK